MDPAPDLPLSSKIDQVKQHLDAWKISDWLVFFAGVPLLLLLVFSLPWPVKSEYFIFSTKEPFALHTYLSSAYTHTELFPHLVSNMSVYFVAITAIFAFEDNRQRFFLMAGTAFLLVPFICAILTIGLWDLFNTTTSMQGFSGIDAALLAYAFLVGVTWFLEEKLGLFDHPESFAGSRGKYLFMNSLLAFMLGLIVFAGIMLGYFANTGAFVSNGIAHFGGFMAGLLAFLAYDLSREERRGFDTMLCISIAIGFAVYGLYLYRIVIAVRG